MKRDWIWRRNRKTARERRNVAAAKAETTYLRYELEQWDNEISHILGEKTAFRRVPYQEALRGPVAQTRRRVMPLYPDRVTVHDVSSSEEMVRIHEIRLHQFILAIQKNAGPAKRYVRFYEVDPSDNQMCLVLSEDMLDRRGPRDLAKFVEREFIRCWVNGP